MKILTLVAHPNLGMSRVHKTWTERLKNYGEITVHNLYEAYPIRNINVSKEQELVLEHDRIILQFPLLWYSMPSLLKQWQEEIFASIWARNGDFVLENKEIMLAISIGAPKEAYDTEGFNGYTLEEMNRPFEAFANINHFHQLPTYAFYNASAASQDEINQSTEQYLQHIFQV